MKLWLIIPLAITGAAPSHFDSWKDCPGVIAAAAPPELPACVAASGAIASRSIHIELGDGADATQASSTLPVNFGDMHLFFTDTTVNVVWRSNQQTFTFENVGGTGEAVLRLNTDQNDRLEAADFAWQNRPLNLTEVLDRARRLQQWLAFTGYLPAHQSGTEVAPFQVQDDDRLTGRRAHDWAEAEALMANESENVEKVRLYSVASADTEVSVWARNMRRTSLNFDRRGNIAPVPGWRRTIFDGDGGYEWLLTVRISRPAR